MLRFIAGLVVWICVAVSAWAQGNPYAAQRGSSQPVLPDGTLNWPTYFKSPETQAKLQNLFEIGACRGNSRSVLFQLENNRIEVNQLTEGSLAGRVLAVDSGMVLVMDPAGMPITLVSHPAGVTKVDITGKIPVAALSPGMCIRMSAGVDERSQGLAKVEALDVITPTQDTKPKGVEAGRVQTIIGTISKIEGEKLRLAVVPGKMHRLTFQISENTTVDVKGSALNLVSTGDEVSTKGRLFTGQGDFPTKMLFASEIIVKKATAPVTTANANPPAGK